MASEQNILGHLFRRLVILFGSINMNVAIASSGGYFLPGFMYWTESVENTESNSWNSSNDTDKSTYTHSNLNLSIGYKTNSDILIGLKHFQYSIANQEGDSAASANRAEYSATGLGIGFQFGEFIGKYSLLLLEAPTLTFDAQSISYQGGDGSIIDVGYFFKIKGYHFGPMFSMIEMNFKERYVNGAKDSSFGGRTQSYLFPYFAVFLTF